MRAWAVVDLGFGDAGKGLLTDWLVREVGADTVVRFNGGAQAGHNVVTADGRHHTFAQIGAGSFVFGVRTVLGPRVLVHPTALLVETRVLAQKGPAPTVVIDARAPLITPFHQALNRLRELARGDARHGSCGVGVGEAVRHGLLHPEQRMIAADLRDTSAARRKLHAVRETLAREVVGDGPDRRIFDDPGVIDRWLAAVAELVPWVTDSPRLGRRTVFEGAQGVLLDETVGFHPHTTWSTTTDAWARELAPDLEVIGVCRAWMVRHGPGPFPTEDVSTVSRMMDHNQENPWQGRVRTGHFDPTLIRYALGHVRVDRLAITHLDGLRRGTWRHALDYGPIPSPGTLEDQERTGRWLSTVRPELAPERTEGVIEAIEEVVGRRVDLVSTGPTAGDVVQRGAGGAC